MRRIQEIQNINVKWSRSATRTSTLRKIHLDDSDDLSDRVTTKMLHKRLRWPKHIMSHPTIRWVDDYDSSGKHYSRRDRSIIVGAGKRKWQPLRLKQEREFKYSPAIPWKSNPAYWDRLT